MKKPSLQALRGRVEKIAGAVEARVGHVLGNDTLEADGLKRKTTGEARQEAGSKKKKAAPAETAGPEKGGAVAVAEEVTPEVVEEVAPTTDAPPVEVAPAEKKRAPKNKPDAPAKKAKSVVQPDAPKPNRAHRRHPNPR